jgi:hypothetical protein
MAKVMYVAHAGALIGERLRRHEAESATSPFRGDEHGTRWSDIAGARAVIVRWSSWLLGREIHLSRMSGTWLRTHEVEWNKHALDR